MIAGVAQRVERGSSRLPAGFIRVARTRQGAAAERAGMVKFRKFRLEGACG